MNGYIAFYSTDRTEVHASTLYAAKLQALEHFRKKHPRRKIKDHEITAHLAEKAGEPVVHVADF